MEARGPPPRCRSGRERSPRTASRAGYIDVRSFRCGELRLRRSEVLFVTRVEGEECVGDRPERKALRDVVGGCPASNAIHGHINDFLVRTGLRSGVSELQLPCFTAVRAEIALMSGGAFAVTHHTSVPAVPGAASDSGYAAQFAAYIAC